MNEAETLLIKHFKMYNWEGTEGQAIYDFIMTIREGLQEDLDKIRTLSYIKGMQDGLPSGN